MVIHQLGFIHMSNAIYAGSFDPITNGHIDIINRAKKVADHITVAVIQNPEKNVFLSIKKRLELVQTLFENDPQVSVESFDGLLADYARKKKVTYLIRGLRAISDFEYEFQMALTNKDLNDQIDTIFLMTDKQYSYLSSSIVRQVAQYNGDISKWVPSIVEETLKATLRSAHE